MAKTLFKGLKVVQQAAYDAAQDKAGYLWFVRPDNAEDGTIGDIYFGSRHYGSVDEASNAKIKAALEGFLGDDDKTVKEYVDDIIDALDLECVSESGKPIVSVCQTNGQVSAAVGTIDAENVNISEPSPSGSSFTSTDVDGALYELLERMDGMFAPTVGGSNKIITTIGQSDGIITAETVDKTAASIPIADPGQYYSGYTVEAALEEIAERVDQESIFSTDNTLVLTPTTGGTNASVNIDGITLKKDPISGAISTTLQITATTPSSSTVKEEYILVDQNGISHGDSIKIYKDSALQSVELVDLQEEPADWPSGQTFSVGQYLRFDYLNAEGEDDIVYVNVSEFLVEAEFKDGLQVNAAGEVSAKLDDTAGSDSEKYLYIKPGSGSENGSIALSGITDDIAEAKSVVEHATGNTHVTVTSAADDNDGHMVYTVNEDDIASASALTEEIAARKAVDGQTGQTYDANTGSTYISGATSLNNADVLLDAAVKDLADNAYSGVTAGNGISATTVANNTQTVSIKPEASTAATVAAGHIELAFNNSGEVYGIMYYDDEDPES